MRVSKYSSILLGSLVFAVIVPVAPTPAWSADADQAASLREIRKEIRELAGDRERDLEKIQHLEKRVNQLEGENLQLKNSNAQIKSDTVQTTEQVKSLQHAVEEGPPPGGMAKAVQGYLGSHTFTITGAAGMDFIVDQQSGALDGLHHQTQNSFFLDMEPMILYRPADWLLFEAVLAAGFGNAGTGTDLSSARFFLFPNDYLTIVGGLFDQPFGDWYEDESPMWINRFVTAPLPFGVEPVVPPGEIGLQLRGGFQWGKLGQDFDYTVWVGNGPNFSEPVPGAAMDSPTAVAFSETNGKAFGGRFRVYPLPIDCNFGRLELGVSTYDGKWSGGKWLTSWGVDFAYLFGDLQARGEWVQSYRQMPSPFASDNRQGWYLQAGYFLNHLNIPGVPDKLNDYIHRLEPLVRYAGVNQRFVASDDITGATGIGVGGLQAGLIPDFGLSGSPALFAPHSREVALGLDYWFEPAIVWENEFDFELPRAGGYFVDGSGVATPAGSIPNDKAFLSRFTVGF
jgi:hypothetical protein